MSAGIDIADADLPSIAEPAELAQAREVVEDAGLDLPSLREPLADLGEVSADAVAPPVALQELDLDDLIAEADTLLGLGEHAPAIQCLERVLGVEAENLCALEKLGELHAATGDRARAEEVWLRASKNAQLAGDEARVSILQARIGSLGGASDQEEGASLALNPLEPAATEIEIEFDLEGGTLGAEPDGVSMVEPDSEASSQATATTTQEMIHNRCLNFIGRADHTIGPKATVRVGARRGPPDHRTVPHMGCSAVRVFVCV